ncbi:hypothetical protein [Nonomuraea wenchangensis]|uniref:hypothetical protein n=1 Tax=Nonomuraea wenchangensis TaxID=568860 RepID=UPI003325E053
MTALLSGKGRHRRGYRPPRPRPVGPRGSWTGWSLLSRFLADVDDFSRPRSTPLALAAIEAPAAGHRRPYYSPKDAA